MNTHLVSWVRKKIEHLTYNLSKPQWYTTEEKHKNPTHQNQNQNSQRKKHIVLQSSNWVSHQQPNEIEQLEGRLRPLILHHWFYRIFRYPLDRSLISLERFGKSLLTDSGREKFQFQTQNQLKTKNETHILGREIRGKIQHLLAYFIGEIRVFEVEIFVVEDSCRHRRRGGWLRSWRCSRSCGRFWRLRSQGSRPVALSAFTTSCSWEIPGGARSRSRRSKATGIA